MKTVLSFSASFADIRKKKDILVLDEVKKSAVGDSGISREFPNLLTVSAPLARIARQTYKNKFGKSPSMSNEDERKQLEALIRKEKKKFADVYRNGVDVKIDGSYVRYSFGFFGASNSRTSTFVMVPVDTMDEVFERKCKLMGLKTRERYKTALCFKGDTSKMVYAQAMTREAARMGASTPLSEEAMSELRKLNVLYVDDFEVFNNAEYFVPTTGEKGNHRSVTLQDGGAIGGLIMGAEIAMDRKEITSDEHDWYLGVLKAADYNVDILEDKEEFVRIHEIILGQYQIRSQGSFKGTLLIFPLEQYVRGQNGELIHGIIPKSVRKYDDGTWADIEAIEIMKKNADEPYAIRSMSAALVLAGGHARYDLWNDVLQWTEQKYEEALSDDMATASHGVQYCLNTFTSVKEMTSSNINSSAVLANEILKAAAPLYSEPYVWNTFYDKAQSAAVGLIAGNVPVPGAYPLMMTDPFAFMDKVVKAGLVKIHQSFDKHIMQTGEYWYDGKTCRAAAGRSPLTNSNQMKVFSLCKNEGLKHFRGILFMNAVDCIWLDMSGADVDGDECLLVLEESRGNYPLYVVSEFLDALEKNSKVVIYTPGAKPVPHGYSDDDDEEQINFIADTLVHGSQVGRLNNLSVMWQEMGLHLWNVCLYAEDHKCNRIRFVDDPGMFAEFPVKISDTEPNTLLAQAIPGDKVMKEGIILVRRAKAKAKDCKYVVDLFDVFQSIEVDGPKTERYVQDDEIFPHLIKATSWSMLARQFGKGKILDEDGNFLNLQDSKQRTTAIDIVTTMAMSSNPDAPTYNAFTTLGYITRQASEWWKNLKSKLSNGGNKGGHTLLLQGLLSDDESISVAGLIDELKVIHDKYSRSMADIANDKDMDADAKSIARKQVIETARTDLENFADENYYTRSEVAVAAYMRCHLSQNKKSQTSIKFGWLLPEDLLAVFSRCPERCVMVSLRNVQHIQDLIGKYGAITDGRAWVQCGKFQRNLELDANLSSAANQNIAVKVASNGTPYIFVKFDENRGAARDPRTSQIPGVISGTEHLFKAHGLTMRLTDEMRDLYKTYNVSWVERFFKAVERKSVFLVTMDDHYNGILMSQNKNTGKWTTFARFIPDNYGLVMLNNCKVRFIEDDRTDEEIRLIQRQRGWNKRGWGSDFERCKVKTYEDTGFVNGLSVEVIAE